MEEPNNYIHDIWGCIDNNLFNVNKDFFISECENLL